MNEATATKFIVNKYIYQISTIFSGDGDYNQIGLYGGI